MRFEPQLNGFNIIYHSTHSDDYLWFLIFRENQNEKKTKTHPNTKLLPIFNDRNNNTTSLIFK